MERVEYENGRPVDRRGANMIDSRLLQGQKHITHDQVMAMKPQDKWDYISSFDRESLIINYIRLHGTKKQTIETIRSLYIQEGFGSLPIKLVQLIGEWGT
jgi:hypothetical protein